MFDRLDDTIIAVGTPSGHGMRGVVRASGSAAREVASILFAPHFPVDWNQIASPIRFHGRLRFDADMPSLPAELLVFPSPRSYTREDVVEFHAVAAPAVLSAMIDRTIEQLGESGRSCGCVRRAEPGEFTARAFFRGAMDLSQVEGVLALIRARSDAQLRAAQDWREGRLAADLKNIRQELIEMRSCVEASLDFADEPTNFISPEDLHRRIARISLQMRELLERANDSDYGQKLPRVMIVGPPNSGKSTLMNRLSGLNRAVCSPVPGTTRDLLTAVALWSPIEVELVDTAGVEVWGDPGEVSSRTFLERELPAADLICYVLDLQYPPLSRQVIPCLEPHSGRVLYVANKADLCPTENISQALLEFRKFCSASVQAISALRGDGIDALRRAILTRLTTHDQPLVEHRVVMNARHREALRCAVLALDQARARLANLDDTSCEAELVASDLRVALTALDELFGEVTTEDLLQRIFADFCIGK